VGHPIKTLVAADLLSTSGIHEWVRHSRIDLPREARHEAPEAETEVPRRKAADREPA
jgi:hypothetical protein